MTFYYFAIFISSLTHSILRYFFIVYVWTNNLQWLLIYNVMFYLVGILSLVRSLLKWGLISIFPFFHVFVFVFVFIAYHEFSLCKLCRCFLFSLIWFAIFWRYCFFRLLTRYFLLYSSLIGILSSTVFSSVCHFFLPILSNEDCRPIGRVFSSRFSRSQVTITLFDSPMLL